jgi:hypothetical protein
MAQLTEAKLKELEKEIQAILGMEYEATITPAPTEEVVALILSTVKRVLGNHEEDNRWNFYASCAPPSNPEEKAGTSPAV